MTYTPPDIYEFYKAGYNKRTKQLTAILDLIRRESPEILNEAYRLFDTYELKESFTPNRDPKYQIRNEGDA